MACGILVLGMAFYACSSVVHRPYAEEIQEQRRRFSAVTYPEGDFVRPAPLEVGQYVMYSILQGEARVVTSYDVLAETIDGWQIQREWMTPTQRRVDTFLLADRELGEISRAEGLEIILGQRGASRAAGMVQVVGGVFKGTTEIETEVKLNGQLRVMQCTYNPAVLLTGIVSAKLGSVTIELLEFGRFRTALKF